MLRKIFGWLFGSRESESGEIMQKLEEANGHDLGLDHVAEIGTEPVKKRPKRKPAKKKVKKGPAKKKVKKKPAKKRKK